MKDRFSGQPSHTSETNRVSSLLFLGVLLFATLVVPGIALTTQWVMDIPAVEKAESQARVFELNAEERETLRRFHHTRVARSDSGFSGNNCSASTALGADSIFTGLCTETAN